MPITRREILRRALATAAALALPPGLPACAEGAEAPGAEPESRPVQPERTQADPSAEPGEARLREWVRTVRARRLALPEVPLGRTAAGVGELAIGTPYEAYTLEAYLKAGGSPMRTEPLTLALDRFDCVSLVESCLAVARLARRDAPPAWEAFAREMEQMRYRGGRRQGYLSRLHYFSEWIDDNAARGLVRPLGQELGGVPDRRPLRFMTAHRDSYPALADPQVFEQLKELERGLDGRTRWVVPPERIPDASGSIQTGDILAFATAIEGLDVTHSAYAYRDDDGVLRVLHAPLSGGVVEITRATLPEYVARIRRATGILVARPV